MILKDDILKLNARRKLYNFIDKNQGLNIREISRTINMPKTTLLYHLKYLKKLEMINEKKEGRYRRIFTANKIGNQDKEILAFLRRKISVRIFLHLIFSLAFSQKELCKELELTPATVNYHIKKFIEFGIIEEAKVVNGRIYPYLNPKTDKYTIFIKRKPLGSEKIYIRANQEIIEDIWRILITYKSSLSDKNIIDLYHNFQGELNLMDKEREKRGIKIPRHQLTANKKMFKLLDFINNEMIRPPFAL